MDHKFITILIKMYSVNDPCNNMSMDTIFRGDHFEILAVTMSVTMERQSTEVKSNNEYMYRFPNYNLIVMVKVLKYIMLKS